MDAKRNLVQLQGENTRLQDTHNHLKEDLERAQASIKSLKEQVKNQRDEYSKELHELKYTVSSEKHKHDSERSDLQEQLNKVCLCYATLKFRIFYFADWNSEMQKIKHIQSKRNEVYLLGDIQRPNNGSLIVSCERNQRYTLQEQ